MKSFPPSSTRSGRPAPGAAILLYFVLAASAAAQSATRPGILPRLNPRPEARTFAAAAASLDWETSLRLALWASSESGDAPRAYAAVAAAVPELRAAVSDLEGEGAAAEKTLEFMHSRFLRAYSERQTRLDVLIATGAYNCVSSAALYVVLGTAVGLDVSGVMTVDHAFCAVRVGEELVDVETTSVYGYDPGSKKEFHDAFGRATGFAYVPPRNYRDRKSIGRPELLSLILSNRAADAEASGRFADAVGPAVDRWALLGGGEAVRNELADRLANYGAALARAGDEPAALDWMARAASLTGPHPRWDELARSASNNLAVRLLRRGDIAGAKAAADRYGPILSADAARDLRGLIADAELLAAAETAVSSGDGTALSEMARGFLDSGVLPAARIREVEVYAALKLAQRAGETSGWAAALAKTEEAIARLGTDRRLEDARRTFRANRIAELHNAFAALFNAKRYREARDAAEAALSYFPGERRFRENAELADRALGAARP